MLLLQCALGVLLSSVSAIPSLTQLHFGNNPGLSTCGLYEEFRHCGSPCPANCDTLKEVVCCEVACISGCFCQDGFILETDPKKGPKKCIGLDQCPLAGDLSFESPALSVLEGSGKAVLNVVRQNGSYSHISCKYKVVNPTGPFAGLVGDLDFPDGVTSKNIELPIEDNTIRNPDITVGLELFEPSRKANIVGKKCVLTILDDDMNPGYLELERNLFSVPEDVGSLRVPVKRQGGTDGQLRVKYRTVPDSAYPSLDFSPQTGELVFEEGESSKTVTVDIVDDDMRETAEKFKIEFFDFDTGPGVINFKRRSSVLTADITIVDNDMRPGVLQLERPSYTVFENAGTLNISVVRVDGQDGLVKTRFEIRPKTAVAAQDFEIQRGELVFEEGERLKTIRIQIVDDAVREKEESFELLLLDPQAGPGTINFRGLGSTKRTTITITDDDMNPGTLELDKDTYEVVEDAGYVLMDVVRKGGKDGRITVQYQTRGLTAVENVDFVPLSGELVFEEGETRKTIRVTINDDGLKEPLETLEVQLLNPTPGPGIVHFRGFGPVAKALVKIRDNDMTPGVLVLERDAYEVREDLGLIQIGVLRLDGVDGRIEVHYHTVPKTAAAGKDFESVAGHLVFEEGEKRKIIAVPILNDETREPSKFFEIHLMDPKAGPDVINFRGLGRTTACIITIADDDMTPGILQFERPSYQVVESVGALQVLVVRKYGSDGEIRVKYQTVAGTAVVNRDFVYAEGEIVFGEGESRKDITVRIIDDDVRESIKSFQIHLLDAAPGLGVINFKGLGQLTTTVVTITDDDMNPGSFVFENPFYEIVESVGTVNIGVERTGGSDGQMRVRYCTVPKSARVNQDFLPIEGELVFEEGQTRHEIVIQVLDDDIREPTEGFEVELLDLMPGDGVINFRRFTKNPKTFVSIIDNDMSPGSFAFETPFYEVSETVGILKVGVKRIGGTDGQMRVKYRTVPKSALVNKDFVPIEGELVFEEGQTRQEIVIQILDDNIRELTKGFEVELLDPTPGEGVINFRRFTKNPTAVISILDNDMIPGSFVFDKPLYELSEGSGTAKMIVQRVGGTDGQIRVKYRTVPKSALVNKDFLPVEGELVFEEGQTRQEIVVQILDDDVREPKKTFEVELLDPTAGEGVINFKRFTTNPTAVVTILDNDMNPGSFAFDKPLYELSEGCGTAKIAVQRIGGTDGQMRVKYRTVPKSALVNKDFLPIEGELVFEEGQTRQEIVVQVLDDDIREPTKTFEVELLEPTPGEGVINFRGFATNPKTVVSITDNDMKPGSFQLERPTYDVFESMGTILVGVVRTEGTDGEMRVKYKTVPKTAQVFQDFIPAEGELVFGEKEERKDIVIKILNDEVREGTKTFEVQLVDVTPGAGVINYRRFATIPTATISILDDDMKPGVLQLEEGRYQFYENVGSVKIPVMRVGGSDGQVKVFYRTTPKTALNGPDFVFTSGEIIFNEGETKKFIEIQIMNDNTKEGTKSFEVELLNPQAGKDVVNFRGFGQIQKAEVYILDDDSQAGYFELERSSYEVPEGVGQVQIPVVRLGGTDGHVAVKYRTVPTSASPQSDFVQVEGELVFEDREDKKFISVQILNDKLKEPAEVFEVQLFEPMAGKGVLNFRGMGTKQKAVVTIQDDDMTPGYLELEETSYVISENVGTLTIPIRRVEGTDGQMRVGYMTSPKSALPGFDFTPIKGELVFEDGETRKTIQVPIRDDNQKEPAENFEILLLDPVTGLAPRNSGPKQKALVTINDDDWHLGFFEFEQESYRIVENAGSMTVTVTRQRGSDGQVRIRYQTVPKTAQPSSDFQPVSGELVFDDGETKKTITVPILNDGVRESTETFEIQLLEATPPQGFLNFRGLGLKHSTVVSILDDDGNPGFLEMEEPSYTVSEGLHTVKVMVIRRGGSDGRLHCRYKTTARTTVSGFDFEPGSGELTFEDGETQKAINIKVLNDHIKDPIKSFEVQLLDPLPSPELVNFNVVGSRARTLVTVAEEETNPGFVQMELPSMTVKENVGVVQVPVIRKNSTSGQLKVKYEAVPRTAQEETDFKPLFGELVFEDGDTRKIIFVHIVNDRQKEHTESFEVQLIEPSPGPGVLNFEGLGSLHQTVITILDDDMNHGFLELERPSYHFSEDAGPASIGVVRLEGLDGRIRVRYHTMPKTAIPGTDYLETSGELVFDEGVARQEFQVEILNDHLKESTKTFEVQLFEPTIEGEDATFRALGARSISLVSIWDDDHHPGVFQFRENQISVHEGDGSVKLTIVRTDGTDGSVSVRLRTVDGSARLGEDYALRTPAVNFDDGETEKSVEVDIIDDPIREGEEHFKIGLFDPTNGALLGQNSIFAVTIIDDDGFVPRPAIHTGDENQVFFTERSVMVSESTPFVRFKIRREGDFIPLKVFVETLDGTARGGIDYRRTRGEISFKPDEIELTITVKLIDNPNRSGVRYFKVRLTNPSSGVVVRGKDVLTVILDTAEEPPSESKTNTGLSFSGRTSEADPAPVAFRDEFSGQSRPRPPMLPSTRSSGQSSFSPSSSSLKQRGNTPRGQEDCDVGLVFKSCFFGCPEICNLVADSGCPGTCRPSCVCPDGMILESLHSSKCVSRSQCPSAGGHLGGGLLNGGGDHASGFHSRGGLGGLLNGGAGGGLLGGGGGGSPVGGLLGGGGGGGLLGGGGGGNPVTSLVSGGGGGNPVTSLVSGGGGRNPVTSLVGGSGGGGLVGSLLGGGGGGGLLGGGGGGSPVGSLLGGGGGGGGLLGRSGSVTGRRIPASGQTFGGGGGFQSGGGGRIPTGVNGGGGQSLGGAVGGGGGLINANVDLNLG